MPITAKTSAQFAPGLRDGLQGLKWVMLGLGAALALTPAARAENPEHVRQLLQTNACENCDLSGTNLSGLDLRGANLRGTDLRGANLTASTLTRANLSGAMLSGADLAAVDLRGANLQNTNLAEAKLGQACALNDLGLSPVDCQVFNLVQRLGPTLCDAAYGLTNTPIQLGLGELCGADLPSNSLDTPNLDNNSLDTPSLVYLGYGLLGFNSGLGQLLRGPTLTGADLRGADLSGLNLEGADLRYAQLSGANLEGAQLTYALLIGADLQGARGDFSQAFVTSADVGRLLEPLLQEQALDTLREEGRSIVGAMNRAQQAHFLEHGAFASELDELGLGVEAEGEGYRFAIAQVAADYAVNTAIARESSGESYLGLVYRTPENRDYGTVAILCVAPAAFTELPTLPPAPTAASPRCPDGFTPFSF